MVDDLTVETPVDVRLIDEIKCDSTGYTYTNTKHDITVCIPLGSLPEGTVISMKIGVNLYGAFRFPEDVRPISPILWLCADQNINFLKPLEVTLPHFLHCTNDEQCKSLHFLKASHEIIFGHFQFKFVDRAIFKPHISYGTLYTTHCCYLCIASNLTEENTPKTKFALITAFLHTKQRSWRVYFCVTYLLHTCMQVT